jgi:hypothetical protein
MNSMDFDGEAVAPGDTGRRIPEEEQLGYRTANHVADPVE